MATEILIAPFVESNQIARELYNWIRGNVGESEATWLDQTLLKISENPSELSFFTQFSAASRQVGKADLRLTNADLQTAQSLRSGWTPKGWSVDQATRSLLLLAFPSEDANRYVATVEKLRAAADVAEQVAIYQTLPLLPHTQRFEAFAIEGLRTNMTAVFNAIALRNPYPAEYFNEAAWNQMILKALFVESQLSQIQGIDERANAPLAQMLSDYAHERWAAGRKVNPQLWRPLGPQATGDLVADLERVVNSPELAEQQAAALACASAPDARAQALLDCVPALKQQIAARQLTWESFSQTHP